MLQVPRPIEPDIHLFKRMWNSVCDFFGFKLKFLTDQFHLFIQYLKTLGVDEETLLEINEQLH